MSGPGVCIGQLSLGQRDAAELEGLLSVLPAAVCLRPGVFHRPAARYIPSHPLQRPGRRLPAALSASGRADYPVPRPGHRLLPVVQAACPQLSPLSDSARHGAKQRTVKPGLTVRCSFVPLRTGCPAPHRTGTGFCPAACSHTAPGRPASGSHRIQSPDCTHRSDPRCR